MPLPQPVGRQRDVLYYPDQGHTVVLGTAGSGKTTLAILRAKYLAGHSPNHGRTLLVTYNTMLATYLRTADPGSVRNVDVRHYHLFARGYLNSRGRMPVRGGILERDSRLGLIGQSIRGVRVRYPDARVLQHPIDTIAEEIAWIQRMGISTAEAYAGAERVNRGGFRVASRDRAHIWEVYEEYLRLREERRVEYDWEDIASAVTEEFRRDDTPRLYRHIVIDEGQDFSPVMLRSLAAAVPPDGSITFFGDMAQQVYGGRISWRDAGLRLPHGIVEFRENYRNTKQIAEFALALAAGPHFRGVADMVAPTAPKAEGVLPTLVRCAHEQEEMELLVSHAAKTAATRTVGILLRDRSREEEYIAALAEKGVIARRLHRRTPAWRADPGVWVGTYYSGKGLEFELVLLPHLDADTIPDASRVRAIGDEAAAYAEEARLLYVAITRARAELLMTYNGERTRVLEGIDPELFEYLELW